MKFVTRSLLWITVLALVLCASASALTVAFSQIGQESDWRTANTDNVNAAIEAAGWELVYSDGQQKQENQIAALRSFITQGVDYILFTGVVNTGWEEVLTEVNEAEIPLILLDRIPDCADQIEYVALIFFTLYLVPKGRETAQVINSFGDYLEQIVDFFLGVVVAERKSQASVSNLVGKSQRKQNVAGVKAAGCAG